MRDDYKVDAISVTKLLAAKSQLTNPHTHTKFIFFYARGYKSTIP